ncbi:hypothetical protein HanIR_Chr15g0751911 [Helianthus annuus]|nr:hypothetical protein HanIR_Chr15g0751911 [Helianthus annuus]
MVGAIKKAKPSPGLPFMGNMLTRNEVLKEATESPSQSLKGWRNMTLPDWLRRSNTALLLVSAVICKASWLIRASF